MEKERLSFQVDDPELLDFIYSLGRERSKIINFLLKECMEEGDGYVPLRIMAATGFSYKNKKAVKRTNKSSDTESNEPIKSQETMPQDVIEPIVSVVSVLELEPESKPKPEPRIEPTSIINEPVTSAKSESITASLEQESAVSKPVASLEPESTYVSSAPKIQNADRLRAGLAGFGLT